MEYFVHANAWTDWPEDETEILGAFDTIAKAQAVVAAGDPQKFYSITDRIGAPYELVG